MQEKFIRIIELEKWWLDLYLFLRKCHFSCSIKNEFTCWLLNMYYIETYKSYDNIQKLINPIITWDMSKEKKKTKMLIRVQRLW